MHHENTLHMRRKCARIHNFYPNASASASIRPFVHSYEHVQALLTLRQASTSFPRVSQRKHLPRKHEEHTIRTASTGIVRDEQKQKYAMRRNQAEPKQILCLPTSMLPVFFCLPAEVAMHTLGSILPLGNSLIIILMICGELV